MYLLDKKKIACDKLSIFKNFYEIQNQYLYFLMIIIIIISLDSQQ